jgi:DNA replication protein DnaC
MDEQAKKSIVRIYQKQASSGSQSKVWAIGCGFLAGDRSILTCCHVIRDVLSPEKNLVGKEVELDFPFPHPGSGILKAKVILATEQPDLARLELLSDPPARALPLPLSFETNLWDHQYSAFGITFERQEGYWVSGKIKSSIGDGTIQMDSDSVFKVEKGFSGTVLWDDHVKKAVGMVAITESAQEMKAAYAISMADILEKCPDLEVQTAASASEQNNICGYSNKIHEDKKKIDYSKYLLNLSKDLEQLTHRQIPRFFKSEKSCAVSLLLKKSKINSQKISAKEVLSMSDPVMILGEPGSGKTYLLNSLALDVINDNSFVPIIIEGKYWGVLFSTVIDAICFILKPSQMNIDKAAIESDLANNKYIILIDGYDEIRNSKLNFEIEIKRYFNSCKIILTSRETNYHGELYNFLAYKIEELSDDQIDQYAIENISIKYFSNRLRDLNLLDLARLPLYLWMLCIIVKENEGAIPNNKSVIHERFAIHLLEEYPYKRNPSFEPKLSLESKLNFLSKLARRVPLDLNLINRVESAKDSEIYADEKILLSEILDSGLLKGNYSQFDFVHPSFRGGCRESI